MKRLWVIIFVIPLFAQNPPRPSFKLEETLYFKSVEGVYKINSSDNDKITGELISIKLNQDLNPMTGFTSEVVFKPSKKPLISPLLVGGTLNDGEYYIFNAKDIEKIEIYLEMTMPYDSKKHGWWYDGPLVFSWSEIIYSDEIQKEYSNQAEVNKIIDDADAINFLYKYENDMVEKHKKGLLYAMFTLCVVFPLSMFLATS